MTDKISLKLGDIVNLSFGYIVEITRPQTKEPYYGSDINNGEDIQFTEKDVESINSYRKRY